MSQVEGSMIVVGIDSFAKHATRGRFQAWAERLEEWRVPACFDVLIRRARLAGSSRWSQPVSV